VELEANAESEVETERLTAAELAVENVPSADEAELSELEAEENEEGKSETDE
jgi:hypothetical protein